MMKKKEKHNFALYYKDLNKDDLQIITDKNLFRRISKVLRLQINDNLILFNDSVCADCTLSSINKDNIEIKVNFINKIEGLKPKINIFVGLLKKESFEDILYDCVELGATSITPILTSKIHKNWLSRNENQYKERFQNILISAAEQSKNFFIPKVNSLISFEPFIKMRILENNRVNQADPENILLDVNGENILEIFKKISPWCHPELVSGPKNFNLILGPEGDFSKEEKEIMKKNKFLFCKLTPTVLRSTQALNVGLGAFRSLFNF